MKTYNAEDYLTTGKMHLDRQICRTRECRKPQTGMSQSRSQKAHFLHNTKYKSLFSTAAVIRCWNKTKVAL